MSYSDSVKAVLDDVITHLENHVEDWAIRPGSDFTRTRKISFSRLLNMLIAMGGDALGSEIARLYNYGDDIPRTSAFCQARAKLKWEAMRQALVDFTSQYPLGTYKGMCVVACDGSEVTLPRDILESSTYVPAQTGQSVGYNAIHATALFDVVGRRYLDCVIQPQRLNNEQAAFCEMVDRWPYAQTPLFICDRGIASYNIFAHIVASGAFFVIRTTDKKTKGLLGYEPIGAADEDLHLILSRRQAKHLRLQPQRQTDYRFINPNAVFDFIDAGSPEYEIDLRVVRFILKDSEYENIVTNLPQDTFSAYDLKELYWMRWGIETSFRDLKYTIGATRLHSSRLAFTSQELLGRMVAYNFGSLIAAHVCERLDKRQSTKHLYTIDFAFALKAAHDFLRACVAGCARPPNIEALIKQHKLPIRANRKCQRRPQPHSSPAFAYRCP